MTNVVPLFHAPPPAPAEAADTITGLSPEALSHYADFYAEIPSRLQFFPQYYRFLLSICLDLEDLGMPGTHGAAQCQILDRQGVAETELSDLQRAEARRLLARRNITAGWSSAPLEDRLHAFMARSATFSMPNKKAAYELTHIVFYLSEYGARPLELAPEAISSLIYCGLQAFPQAVPAQDGVRFAPSHTQQRGVLRHLSETMFDLGPRRSSDWEKMRDVVLPQLGNSGLVLLQQAEDSTDDFGAFFEGFARATA